MKQKVLESGIWLSFKTQNHIQDPEKVLIFGTDCHSPCIPGHKIFKQQSCLHSKLVNQQRSRSNKLKPIKTIPPNAVFTHAIPSSILNESWEEFQCLPLSSSDLRPTNFAIIIRSLRFFPSTPSPPLQRGVSLFQNKNKPSLTIPPTKQQSADTHASVSSPTFGWVPDVNACALDENSLEWPGGRGHFGRALVNSWSQTFTPRACGPAVVVVVLGPGERKKHDVSAKEEVPRGSYGSATIRVGPGRRFEVRCARELSKPTRTGWLQWSSVRIVLRVVLVVRGFIKGKLHCDLSFSVFVWRLDVQLRCISNGAVSLIDRKQTPSVFTTFPSLFRKQYIRVVLNY